MIKYNLYEFNLKNNAWAVQGDILKMNLSKEGHPVHPPH